MNKITKSYSAAPGSVRAIGGSGDDTYAPIEKGRDARDLTRSVHRFLPAGFTHQVQVENDSVARPAGYSGPRSSHQRGALRFPQTRDGARSITSKISQSVWMARVDFLDKRLRNEGRRVNN